MALNSRPFLLLLRPLYPMSTLAFIVIAYLLGSLSFAIIVSKACDLPDPRSYGSANPGATNVLRTGNKAAAIATLVGDGFKGWLAVTLAQHYGPRFDVGDEVVAAVALAVFIGISFRCSFASKAARAWRLPAEYC